MSWELPDGILDRTHEWQQAQDMSLLLNSDSDGPEDDKMKLALLCAQQSVSDQYIAQLFPPPGMPAPTGYDREQPTLQDVFSLGSPRAAGRANQVQGGMS